MQREQQDLPKFRRFGGYTAYVEGWGLYAESLGRELGHVQGSVPVLRHARGGALARDPARRRHRPALEGLDARAGARVHGRNSSAAEARRVSEAERYIAIPGQALAYKIGQLKIRELRTRAETELGDALRRAQIPHGGAGDGALPLDVLEAKIDRWIATAEQGSRTGR